MLIKSEQRYLGGRRVGWEKGMGDLFGEIEMPAFVLVVSSYS